MPDPQLLKVGDKVRVLSVPAFDLMGSSKETLDVLRWMIGKEFEVYHIDPYGYPWLDVKGYPCPEGAEHSMMISDTESWDFAK